MKYTRVVKTAFSICTVVSLLISALLFYNARAIPKYTRMVDTGRQILETVLTMESQEKHYLIYQKGKTVDDVKDRIETLRKSVSAYEKSGLGDRPTQFFEFAVWEEAINLYERLFDQFILYHSAVEKSIADIRELEKRILAVIYSKMNPERGIIALQEIRIHEKGYLIYRNTAPPAYEMPFPDKRKEAVSHLLMWAGNDPRIEELIDEDNRLFDQITANYASQDHTLVLIEKERARIANMAEKLSEEGHNRSYIAYRRCEFLSVILLIMWLIMGTTIVVTRTR